MVLQIAYFHSSMKQILFLGSLLFILFHSAAEAQLTDAVYNPKIHTIKLYKAGDQTSFPFITLNSSDALELDFDDLDNDVKNYYYTFELCNADWTPSMLRPFEYLKGFQNVRITNYRNSSIAFTRYTHYQAAIPDRNCIPIHSGNYLLKVFLNSDTSNVVFTKRMAVVDAKSSIAAQVLQPFNAQWFTTYQKLQIGVTTNSTIQAFNPQDIKVAVLQNNNWKTALFIDRPTIYRGNYLEYSDEAVTAMPAGKEWRWIDLRSLRLKSDRMQQIEAKGDSTFVTVKPDPSRAGQTYVYYRDLNGSYTVETLESVNPFWQGDYCYVRFSYFPPNNKAYEGLNLYLFGELNNFTTDQSSLMTFNPERGAYEKTLFLKQGYYNYEYVTLPQNNPNAYPDDSQTEGNYWGTENAYTILVYYRPFGARADELIGYTNLNSMLQRP
jgi:hypothetical protein